MLALTLLKNSLVMDIATSSNSIFSSMVDCASLLLVREEGNVNLVDWRFLAEISISRCWIFSLSLVDANESNSFSEPSVDMVSFTIVLTTSMRQPFTSLFEALASY